MAWYEIVNAKSDSYVADRDAEDLLRDVSAAGYPLKAGHLYDFKD